MSGSGREGGGAEARGEVRVSPIITIGFDKEVKG